MRASPLGSRQQAGGHAWVATTPTVVADWVAPALTDTVSAAASAAAIAHTLRPK